MKTLTNLLSALLLSFLLLFTVTNPVMAQDDAATTEIDDADDDGDDEWGLIGLAGLLGLLGLRRRRDDNVDADRRTNVNR